ncbi:MAG: hypothetical protein HXY50_04005 [Ignavibacteriaceae bacterium]|nr:hypothetical protein [Ignavibacteriaceae bacterium]
MENQKKFEVFSYLSFGVIALGLILIITKLIPDFLVVPTLIFCLVLLSIRLILRFYFMLKKKNIYKE